MATAADGVPAVTVLTSVGPKRTVKHLGQKCVSGLGLSFSGISMAFGSVTKAVTGGITARRTFGEIEIAENALSNSAR